MCYKLTTICISSPMIPDAFSWPPGVRFPASITVNRKTIQVKEEWSISVQLSYLVLGQTSGVWPLLIFVCLLDKHLRTAWFWGNSFLITFNWILSIQQIQDMFILKFFTKSIRLLHKDRLHWLVKMQNVRD